MKQGIKIVLACALCFGVIYGVVQLVQWLMA
jgi:hypothetical protein